MASPRRITSPANPRAKALVRLRKRRERDERRLFPVEGYRELLRALEGGVELKEVWYCPELFLGENEPELLERAAAGGAELVETSEEAFRKVSYRDRPEGLLGVARQFATGLDRLEAPPEPLFLVVESIEKPGNLGTMLRTADAAGVSGVLVCDPTTDPFNPNVVRASVGALFLVALGVASSEDTLEWLRRRGIRSFAATPEADLLHWEADYRGPAALVVGSEQYGLSPLWREEADERVRIPMQGRLDSLNAAMAAGILLYEALRQRAPRTMGG